MSLAIAFAFAVLLCFTIYLTDRYGQLSGRTTIVLGLIVLEVLAALIWRHETHNADINRPFISDSSAVHAN